MLHPQAKSEHMQNSSQYSHGKRHTEGTKRKLGNRMKPGTLGNRLKRLRLWKDKIYGFSLLFCLLSKTAITSCTELRAVVVVSHTPTTWNEGDVALWSVFIYHWRNGEQICTHARTPTEISQLISLYSSQNQPGWSHFKGERCLDWLIFRLTTHAVTC